MVKPYFAACEQDFPQRRSELRRIALALCRGGVDTMEALCAMQRAGPEKLLEIRSIGAKSLPLIAAVCARYTEMIKPSAVCLWMKETISIVVDYLVELVLKQTVLQSVQRT